MTNFPTGDPQYPYAGQSYGNEQHGYPPQGRPHHGHIYSQQYSQQYSPWVQSPYAYPGPPPAAPRPSNARWYTGVLAVIVVALVTLTGVTLVRSHSSTLDGTGSAAVLTVPGGSSGGSGGSGGSANGSAQPASARGTGIVTIVSVLQYQSAESAGTGMILTSDGDVLTNNHVINGSTSITVTVQSTGRSYKADVVGTAPSEDVAVIKMRNASGLQTASFAASSDSLRIGDKVVALGNAGGTGSLRSAAGLVTALNQSITAADESGQDAERLNDLIETNAPIISGDSGGPLYDSTDHVVGMTTAASTARSAQKQAYAIPIENAKAVVKQIERGVQTTTIHIGLPGFLGVTSRLGANGVTVQQVVPGGPADTAGITPGSVIAAVDGRTVPSPAVLRAILTAKDPGDRVSITWVDPNGQQHTSSVRLASGPAD